MSVTEKFPVIRCKKTGRYMAVTSLGFDAEGKRLRCKSSWCDSKTDARKQLAEKLEKREYGKRQSGATVKEFLEDWIKNTVIPNRKLKTVEQYQNTVRVHIVPTLGNIRLVDLSGQDVTTLLGKLARDGKSAHVRRVVYAVLQSALGTAGEILTKDPLRWVEKPKVPQHKPQMGKDVFTPEQAQAFLAEAETIRNYPILYLLLSTGARIGEVLALHRDDVDLKAGLIHFRHTLTELNGRVVGRFSTKTQAGERTISLSAAEVKILTRHFGTLLSEGHGGSPMVFPTAVPRDGEWGRYMLQNSVRRMFMKCLERAGLEHVKLHSLRHASASFMIAAGVDIATVSKRLGHSKVSTTLDMYTAAMPKKDQEAANVMESFMGGKS